MDQESGGVRVISLRPRCDDASGNVREPPEPIRADRGRDRIAGDPAVTRFPIGGEEFTIAQ